MNSSRKEAIHQLFRFIRGREPIVLSTMLVIVLTAWGVIELTNEVLVVNTDAFDRWAVPSLRDAQDLANPIGPTWMEEAGRDVTAIDGIAVMLIAIAQQPGFLQPTSPFVR